MRTFWRMMVALSWVGVVACTTPRLPSPQHVVVVNRDGQLLQPTTEFPEINTPHRYLAGVMAGLATNELPHGRVRQILIFVHGGLNDPTDTLDIVAKHIPNIQTNAYPIFVVWNSGLMSSYFEHLWRIRQGQVEKNWLWSAITCPVYLFADAGRALARAPLVWYYQGRNDLSTLAYAQYSPIRLILPKKPTADDKAGRFQRTQSRTQTNQTQPEPVDFSIGYDHRKEHPVDNAGRMTSYIVTLPFKLLTAPFIDAMGKAAWENMSRRTQTQFCTPQYYSQPNNGHPLTIGEPRDGGLSLFMDDLASFIHTNKTHDWEITVIGHSMGTMVLNEVIRRHPCLPYRNIVYMGAACTFRDFETSVVPCLQTHPDAQFYYLGLHPINEARERHGYAAEIPPLGSLLSWIDNYFTEPQTMPDRTFGAFDNLYDCAPSLPTNVVRQLHFKIFPVCDDRHYPEGNPQSHGAFSEVDFWKETFWKPKKHH